MSKSIRQVLNTLSARQELFRSISEELDKRRDVNEECGYPTTSEMSPWKYKDLYKREPVSNRVVQVMPKESWRVLPEVYEDEDPAVTTPFEEVWSTVGQNLRGEECYYTGEDGSPIWEYLKRIDILSGIGAFGVLFLGLDDGIDPSLPVPGILSAKSLSATPPGGTTSGATNTSTRELVFLRCFDESLVHISQYEVDPRSPRFGQPVLYNLTLNDPRNYNATGAPLSSIDVHWTRIIHVADNLESSEIFGTSRMEPVLNRLLDLRKLYGGSAEMYWKGAFPGYSLETHPQAGGDVEIDEEATKDMMEDYMNGLQRYLAGTGWTVKSLAPQVVDPSPQIDQQIQAICICLGIPIRVFKGSERGELASSQDDISWSNRIRERQGNYLTPRLIVPLVDRLIQVGVLPRPRKKGDPKTTLIRNEEGVITEVKSKTRGGYTVCWPDITTQTADDRAATAVKLTQALVQYIQGNGAKVIAPLNFLTRILGLAEQEALSFLELAEEWLKEHPPEPPPLPPGAKANPADYEGGGDKGKPPQGPPASSGGPPIPKSTDR